MTKGNMLYEGKAKQVFETDNPNEVIVRFKDDATAFNAQKKGNVDLKGEMNNAITTLIFEYLNKKGIPTHFIKQLDEREQLVKKVQIIPLEMVVRNYSAGSMAQRLGVAEGIKSPVTIFDLCYKKDELGDPLINDHHAVFLGAATYDELDEMYELTSDINDILIELFAQINIILVDFKIELGRTPDGKIILADEISPDTCRLWDRDTMKKLDKDRFRRDLGEVTEAYVEIYERLKKHLHGA
ncbi:phosphoribosylaminoimidazolesuccinocarboxamide synthase [Chryseobacterium salipaludis]|uniref:phosphoribosylaminoimidazolesuccinocarboxamide synthase n=1 Tax=Chryseobacterium TaxID=59732 RepID=UPI001FF15FA3|nr:MULTISPECIES: phosphoribosylaminoimidazolesuccinocarboxamide synthase [Chryseobacterium]MCJ8496773.1 phosphoribosylaminoimidazolesuccinocarboxamide synthase [Chryseobacterium salipaludis]MCX3296254.1 phosphoribosylaminoimidazolesuccinocarboxamide synthase [Planobacterium sp. JC490]